MTSTESPNSFTLKCFNAAGYDCLFTVRADSTSEFLERVTKLTTWLQANGYTPTVRPNNGNGRAPQAHGAPAAPVCNLHNRPMKPSKFGGFYCSAKLADGSYCQEKIDPAAPMRQAVAVRHASNGASPPQPPLFDPAPPDLIDGFQSYYNENN